MFVIDGSGDLVGYSIWEADFVYKPLVGCYADGRLVTIAACDRAPETSRIKGPRRHCWFRLPVEHKFRERLSAGDPAVKVLRTEDATPVDMADGPEFRPLRRVEDFLTSASRRRSDLTGYQAFLSAPQTHQLDILFLDFLGRLPDPGARQHYLDQINRGRRLMEIRQDLLNSDEFRNRRLTISDRPGSLITSPLWSLLLVAEALGEERSRAIPLSLAQYQHLDDGDFLDAIYNVCMGGNVPSEQKFELEGMCREEGREVAAAYLAEMGAANGRHLHLNH